MPVVDGIKIDNIEQGGWYQGRQAWQDSGGNWTLSAPGSINKYSNQQGAGQAVSDEVNRQSSVAQGKAPDAIKTYLDAQKKTTSSSSAYVPGPSSAGAGVAGAGVGMAGGGIQAPATIDLKGIYDKYYKENGIAEKEAQIVAAEKNFIEARNKISNNPYLSASSMDNRIARIRQQYELETAPIRNEIATKKADVEMRLKMETDQFQINSDAAKDARAQLESLLNMGALNNANGEDIASITRATGLSSSMIQGMIQNKIQSGYQTTTESFDDGTNKGFILYTIDQGGNIVNQTKQVTGKSTKATGTGYSVNPNVNSFLNSYQTGATATAGVDLDSVWNTVVRGSGGGAD